MEIKVWTTPDKKKRYKPTFNIYEIEVDMRSLPDDEFGGDMESLCSRKTEKSALEFAKKASMKEKCTSGKKLHETWVERVEENEIVEQWAFKKGKETFHIVPC